VLIAVNPRAGARESSPHIERLTQALVHDGFSVEVMTDLSTVVAAAQRRHAAGELRALISAGGDGTVAEIVNRTEPGLPIAVYPRGTANLLANYLGMPANPEAFADVIATASTVQLDAGRANGRIFLLMVGCGFDADVVERLHSRRQGHISFWSYARPILDAIRAYEFPELRVYCDPVPGDPASHAASVTARWAFVVNLPCYAAGLKVAPAATGTDGALDVCTLRHGWLWHGLRYAAHVFLGRHERLPDCTKGLARHVRIESDRPVPYQLDGDPGGMLPLEIEVLPRRLTLVAPAAKWPG
jgi:diacylglycerol kinase family enzyme